MILIGFLTVFAIKIEQSLIFNIFFSISESKYVSIMPKIMKPEFFLQKLHVCCMKMDKNILFTVISIAIYTFFPPLRIS